MLELQLEALPGPLILLIEKLTISKRKFAVTRRFVTTILGMILKLYYPYYIDFQ